MANKALPLLLLGGAAVAAFAMSGKKTKKKGGEAKADELKARADEPKAKADEPSGGVNTITPSKPPRQEPSEIEILTSSKDIQQLLIVGSNAMKAGVSLDDAVKAAFDTIAPGQKPDDYTTKIKMTSESFDWETNPAELYYNLYIGLRAVGLGVDPGGSMDEGDKAIILESTELANTYYKKKTGKDLQIFL